MRLETKTTVSRKRLTLGLGGGVFLSTNVIQIGLLSPSRSVEFYELS